jgi:D-glycero-D-manno-heptose 1,7-bisphosphate phosphatase
MPFLPSAVLLDRDGVITEPILDASSGTFESPYYVEDVHLVVGVVEVIRTLQERSIPIAVVSNQPAAAKQAHSMSQLREVDQRVRKLLLSEEIVIGAWFYCFHHPQGLDPELGAACNCRKPKSGLLQSALESLEVLPSRDVVMVGDSDSDVEAGQRLGISTILVEHPRTAHRRLRAKPDFRVGSVMEWRNMVITDA